MAGSAIGPGASGGAAAVVLVAGGFLAFAKRRRRALWAVTCLGHLHGEVVTGC